jgi:hypothetical protein
VKNSRDPQIHCLFGWHQVFDTWKIRRSGSSTLNNNKLSAYFLDRGEEYHEMLNAGKEPAVPLVKWILEKGKPRTWGKLHHSKRRKTSAIQSFQF